MAVILGMKQSSFIIPAAAAAAVILILLIRKVKAVREFCELLDKTYEELSSLLKPEKYYSIPEIRKIKNRFSERIEKLKESRGLLSDHDFLRAEKLAVLSNPDKVFEEANKKFIDSVKRKYADFFNEFDDSQAEAMIREEDQTLVLAGAGRGQTKTIEGLVQYLIQYRHVNPSEILLISFTNATVNELNKRDLKGAKARTFHNIGNDITKKGFPKDRTVSIYSDDKANIVKKFLNVPAEDPEFLQELTDYYREKAGTCVLQVPVKKTYNLSLFHQINAERRRLCGGWHRCRSDAHPRR